MQLNDREATPLLDELRALMDACGIAANKNELVYILTSACIEGGFDTRAQIVGALRSMGFNFAHVAIALQKGTGLYGSWQLNPDGRYTMNA